MKRILNSFTTNERTLRTSPQRRSIITRRVPAACLHPVNRRQFWVLISSSPGFLPLPTVHLGVEKRDYGDGMSLSTAETPRRTFPILTSTSRMRPSTCVQRHPYHVAKIAIAVANPQSGQATEHRRRSGNEERWVRTGCKERANGCRALLQEASLNCAGSRFPSPARSLVPYHPVAEGR